MHNEALNGQSFYLGIGLKSDETVNFRGLLVEQISIKAKGQVELGNVSAIIPDKPYFYSPYPNPFNPIIELSYYLDKAQNLNISIFDLNGKEIQIIFSDYTGPGFNNIIWNADGLSSGIYFIKYEMEDSFEIKKVTLLK